MLLGVNSDGQARKGNGYCLTCLDEVCPVEDMIFPDFSALGIRDVWNPWIGDENDAIRRIHCCHGPLAHLKNVFAAVSLV